MSSRQDPGMPVNMPAWWSLVILFAFCFGLAACDSPSPAFRDLPGRAIAIEGAKFSVRATRWRAEAIRINVHVPKSRRDMVIMGTLAILKVTGCPVHLPSVEGDETMVRADLNCPGEPPIPERRDRDLPLECVLSLGFRPDGFGGRIAEVDCEVMR